MNKITLTISHTINLDNYESIKPEVTNEFEYDGQITDSQIKSFLQLLEAMWLRNLEKHLERAARLLKAKMKSTAGLQQIIKTYGVDIKIDNIETKSTETPLY